jgi:ribonuclease Z
MLFQERGSFWLFDCGEATQHQVLKSPLKLSKLEKLFVTHLHGDHIFGLPGLLGSRSFQGGHTPLAIYGPPGIRSYVETCLSVSYTHLNFSLEIVEVEEGVVFADDQFVVESFNLSHGIESLGYRIVERDRPGKLAVERLKVLGIMPGPVYGKLKRGEKVELPGGKVINGTDFLGEPLQGKCVVILGDTGYCPDIVKRASRADVLVHEATFADSDRHLAEKYGHSTSLQAAWIAREANVSALILTHISSRYQMQEEAHLLAEARGVFPNTYLAEDHWCYPID